MPGLVEVSVDFGATGVAAEAEVMPSQLVHVDACPVDGVVQQPGLLGGQCVEPGLSSRGEAEVAGCFATPDTPDGSAGASGCTRCALSGFPLTGNISVRRTTTAPREWEPFLTLGLEWLLKTDRSVDGEHRFRGAANDARHGCVHRAADHSTDERYTLR
jgi:hypothetical protein